MLTGLGVADTFMVSAKLGATALAGVALVNRIDNFAKQFFLALAFYPQCFATPSAIGGAGYTRFVMMVAAASMFLFRIGCAYICVKLFNLGVVGIWVAMVSHWVVRMIIFEHRF